MPVKYICGTCGVERMLKFRAGKVNLSKNCHTCASKLMRVGDKNWKNHGGVGTLLYQVWCGMKQRCVYENHKNFSNYGGRGIRACSEWMKSFEAFRDWALQHGYRKGLILDRKDNDGNYEPENCRWVSTFNSCANRRNNILTVPNAMIVKDLSWRGVSQKVIGALFNIPTAYVSAVKHGHAWADLPSVWDIP